MKKRILEYIEENSGKRLRKASIRKALCNTPQEEEKFKIALKQLEKKGEVVRDSGGQFKKSAHVFITGSITVKEGAFGFIDVDESNESIFIPPGHTNGSFSGDIVRVQITDPGNSRGPVGSVVEIVEPAFDFLLGQLAEQHGKMLVRPLRPGSPDIRIDQGQLEAFPNILPGDWIKIEITERSSKFVKGTIIEKVGDAGNLNHELDAVMAEFGLEPMYTDEEEKLAGSLKQRSIKRVDLTKEMIMTIDPVDAKDFDDALSVHNDEDPNTIVIGVHIADVAAYISPKGSWQKKVRDRSFTAYLPGRMVPMLPKILVSNRCSLVEGEEKPAHTVLLHIDRKTGKLKDFERFHSRIIVKKRLNYEEVQKFADNGFKHDKWPEKVSEPLKVMYNLSRIMRQWRSKNEKFIPLEAPEVRVLCNHETMELTGLKHEKAHESNQMVEEYMLGANVAVARELSNKQVPGIYRVHPEPNPESVEEFIAHVKTVYGLNPGDLTERTNAVNFLNEVTKLPVAEVISFDFLRMMQRALYSAEAALHYGLGKGFYSHFTSPIRRFSDLLVHQQLWELESGKNIFSRKALETEAAHITEMESKIDDAYRAAILRFKLYYIRQQMDGGRKDVQAFISRITLRGIKVFIQEFGLYCTINIKNFDDDYYELDQHCRWLTGRSTGKVYKCGDKITVLLQDIDFARRELLVKPKMEDKPKDGHMPRFGKQIQEKKGKGGGSGQKRNKKNKNKGRRRNNNSQSNQNSDSSPKEKFGKSEKPSRAKRRK